MADSTSTPTGTGRGRDIVEQVLQATIVIPCFNEADRLDDAAMLRFATAPGISLLFVDDGSTDRTRDRLEELKARAGGPIELHALAKNQGKAAAVRVGLLRAMDRGAKVVGYADADLSASPDEIERLLSVMEETSRTVVLGSRVALLGRDIRRSPLRHYFGRVFATAASLALDLVIYDTQCGAKLFRSGDALRAALADPFVSRWAFDVELIGRLLAGTPDVPPLSEQDFREVPLERWVHADGSKIGLWGMVRSAAELALIAADLRRRRRAQRNQRPAHTP
jgi:dolichyl-phosphate beta-glucosyltransferase